MFLLLFFSVDRAEAAAYGNVGAYFLNIRNPIEKPIVNMRGNEVREELMKKGYDGTIVNDDDSFTEYAAFSPEQIKSATHNAGTFSNRTRNTLFSLGENKPKPVKLADVVEIDPSVMVDEKGNPIDFDMVKVKTIRKWLYKNLVGQTVTIDDDGKIQKFTAQGITSSTKKRNPRKGGDAQRQTYAGLDNLIKSAVFSHFENADAKHKGIKGQNVYYVPARFGNKIYSIRIKIDIPVHNELKPAFKDLKIEREITPSLSRGHTTENRQGTTQETSGIISKGYL
jgi:hypothetical protein